MMLRAVALSLALCGSAAAEVSVDEHLFTDGMILQRGVSVPIWGQAAPGEEVTVSFAGQSVSATAAQDGSWRVNLAPLVAAGPSTLTIEASNTIPIVDVRVGEVWLCSGQSNMALAMPTKTVRDLHPDVRALRFRDWSDAPGDICWFFALEIHEALGVPVGILNPAKGGARLRTFLPPSVSSDPDPQVRAHLEDLRFWGENWRETTAHLVPYAIRGMIWWQGESDRSESDFHGIMLPALIRSYRGEWSMGDLPFIYVQLPNGKGLSVEEPVRRLPSRIRARSSWSAVMRQAFLTTLDEPNTGMVVTSDLTGGIHPPSDVRPEYALRLANAARVLVYGESLVYSGPVFASAQAEGSQVRIRFLPHTAVGLHSNGAPLQGFALTADRENWVWAETQIDGDDEVLLSSPDVPAPIAVRYAYDRRFRWANLYNVADLAAAPFDSDVVPGIVPAQSADSR